MTPDQLTNVILTNLKFRINANLKGVTYCNAIAEGGEEEWQFGWSQYQASEVATEKASLLNSLTCAEEVWLLNRYLNMSLYQESGVRNQDSYKVSHYKYSMTLKYMNGIRLLEVLVETL